MPKETIYGDPNDRFCLDVGWNRDMDVQVGIRTTNGLHLVDEFYGDDNLTEKIGRDLLKRLEDDAGIKWESPSLEDNITEQNWYRGVGRITLDSVTGSNYGLESLWWNPGRSQINKLIKMLRHARDQAFGKDE